MAISREASDRASLPDTEKGIESALTQQQLEEREATFQLLVDSVKDYAIFMLDSRGYVRTWNPGAQRLKGYSKEEIQGRHFSIFYPEEALHRNHPASILETAAREGRFEEEGWRIRKDGSLFWASVVISAIYNQHKELIGFSKVTRDLTERKSLQDKLLKAYEELQESEARSRLLTASVKDYAIFMLTPQGHVASWNEGAKRIKGFEEAEVLGSHFSRFYPHEAVAAGYPAFELVRALEDGRFEDEGWRLRKDGTLFWANVVLTPLFNEQKEHIGFTKITRDLTERVRNEALMKKNMDLHRLNTDLDNFIYTASHDLKSPISNLEGLLTLMRNKIGPRLEASELQLIELMNSSVQRLNDTILSLIEVTKAQKNLNASPEAVAISGVLQEVKEDLSGMISESGARIREQLEVGEISIARASLKSILYNLISNAIKYHSPDRPPDIRIHTYTEGHYTILRLQDNGLGLSEAQQSKLFSMFKRFHTHVEGTGIGLYIVKRTLENLGGQISVSSTLNKGTTFTLRFPTQVLRITELPASLEDL